MADKKKPLVLGGQELTLSRESVLDLYDMLGTCRPAGSATEEAFLEKWLKPLKISRDTHGNYWKRIGNSPIAWSCHTDTVHGAEGYQLIDVNTAKWEVRLALTSKANCLGADDTLGVWLMREMVKAKRPGLYLFHRAEERGGQGSRWLAANSPALLRETKAMIALDRRGTDSVITRQAGGRCCSDDFAKSLAAKFNGMKYKIDTGGTFTDSASYTDIVGECTNLSVGYYAQHSCREWVDLRHLFLLREALVAHDFADLDFKRKPGEKEKFVPHTWRGYRGDIDEYDGEPYGSGYYQHGRWHGGKPAGTTGYTPWRPTPVSDIADIVRSYPIMIARILHEWGFDAPLVKLMVEKTMDRTYNDNKESKNDNKDDRTIM